MSTRGWIARINTPEILRPWHLKRSLTQVHTAYIRCRTLIQIEDTPPASRKSVVWGLFDLIWDDRQSTQHEALANGSTEEPSRTFYLMKSIAAEHWHLRNQTPRQKVNVIETLVLRSCPTVSLQRSANCPPPNNPAISRRGFLRKHGMASAISGDAKWLP